MAEPTWLDSAREWGAWLLAGVLGVRAIAKDREEAFTRTVDARILATVNPPLLAEQLGRIELAVTEIRGQVDGITERLNKVEIRETVASDEPLVPIRGGGIVRVARE